MLAVDMPLISAELLTFSLHGGRKQQRHRHRCPHEQSLQPLCAIYRRDFLPVAERALRAGKYKIDAAFAGVSVRVIDAGELAAAGFSERSFFNVNTPQDLKKALKE